MLLEHLKSQLRDHIRILDETINESSATIIELVEVISHSFQNGNKLLLCGNGGSAAMMSVRPVVALCCGARVSTALAIGTVLWCSAARREDDRCAPEGCHLPTRRCSGGAWKA